MSSKAKVVITREIPSQGLDILKQRDDLELVIWPEVERGPSEEWLRDNLGGAKGILCQLVDKVDGDFLDMAGPELKVLSTLSAGYDHVDLEALKKRSIRLGVTPNALTDTTADTTVLLVLLATRRGGEAIRAVLDSKWPKLPWSPTLLCGHSLSSRTIGLIGFGRIAQATLVRLLPYGISKAIYLNSSPGEKIPKEKDYMGILEASEKGEFKAFGKGISNVQVTPAKSLDELAAESDVVIVCCALTPRTKHMINAEFLGKMKKDAVIVNSARGGIVDSEALAKALDEGRIWGAGLDVVEGEPDVDSDHVLVKQERCVILPHIGSATYETRGMMAEHAARNLLAGLDGGEMVSEKKL